MDKQFIQHMTKNAKKILEKSLTDILILVPEAGLERKLSLVE